MNNKQHKKYKRNKHHKYQVGTKEYVRNCYLLHLYGITLDDYNTLFINQNGCCAICNKHQSELDETLNVDHCHKTSKVRGLLCGACNRGIGKLKEDINILNNAIKYLQK